MIYPARCHFHSAQRELWKWESDGMPRLSDILTPSLREHPASFLTISLDRANQRHLLYEVSPLTDRDQPESASGVGADVDFCGGGGRFGGGGLLPCSEVRKRVV